MTYKPETYERKFWERVQMTDTCWNWTGNKNSDGYGTLNWFGKRSMAHRVSYELLEGPIPSGLVIDHLCRNVACVNTDHLEPVPQGENVKRGVSLIAAQARQTACKKGHDYTEHGYVDKRGQRVCRPCQYERTKRRRANA